ncbi:MAG: hypothetical protein ACNS60_21235 [Candidatus Cyclobacteriaceae bacterium M2_1C_046]
MKSNKLKLVERFEAPTPKFFKKLRNIGLALAAVGATILASPVVVPAVIVNIAGYLTLAGSILTAVSEATVDEEEMEIQDSIRSVAKENIRKKLQAS